MFQLILILIPFVVAYLVHQVVFFFLKHVTFAPMVPIVAALKRPALFLFLEVGALFAINVMPQINNYLHVIQHALIILIILTIGIACAQVAKKLFIYLQTKHRTEALEEVSKRSLLTQTQILYRAAMFVIVVLTGASILITFPAIKSFGIGILGSAGIAGIALGLAARPILLNLIAGFQIAFTKMLKIGDVVVVEGESGRIEEIFLTCVVMQTPDLRRIVIPISYFIDKPYQNWSGASTDLIGTVFIYTDYTAPFDAIKNKCYEILNSSPLWTKDSWSADIFDMSEQVVKVRLTMSAKNPGDAFNLQCYVRGHMIEFLQREFPSSLPKIRYIS